MKIILLGGVPGVGKTTISHYLSNRYHIPTILSIDTIKESLKLFIQKEEEPYLYTTSHDAYKVENLSIIDAYLKHSTVINSYLKMIIHNIKDSIIIIEGVSINNLFYKELLKDNEAIYINICSTKEVLLKRYEERKRIRNSNWIKHITIIEEISNYLLKECNYNFKYNQLKEIYDVIEKFLYK